MSAGVYNAGQMLAQAVTGTPGHVNAMADAVAHFIRRIGRENIFEGDVYITNDPWEGTGHLHDITVVTPSFHNGSLVGFFACTAHVVDIGGRGLARMRQAFMKRALYPDHEIRRTWHGRSDAGQMLRGNVREPDQLVGDIYALATCNEIGQRRLIDMMDEFDLPISEGIGGFHPRKLAPCHAGTDRRLATQSAKGDMTVDGFDKPITLEGQGHDFEDRILSDFEAHRAGQKGHQLPAWSMPRPMPATRSKCAIAPEIPNNAASLAPFRDHSARNTIVNAVHPAPVALRHIVGHFVPDAVFRRIGSDPASTVVPPKGQDACAIFKSRCARARIARPYGCGRVRGADVQLWRLWCAAQLDGLNATAFPSGVMTMPVEATEHAAP